MTVPVAFYAPLKPPDHPVPSGDRTMARLLVAALARAGTAPVLASGFRSYEPAGDPARQERLRDAALAEADRLCAAWNRGDVDARPRLWFTYHSYYKAPDWIGPAVAARLGIPYGLAEASRAPKRAGGGFGLAHAGAEAALAAADAVFVLTAQDWEALARPDTPARRLIELPPFLDASAWPEPAPGRTGRDGPVALLAVGMMRDGDKLASYRELAAALERVDGGSWRLQIVGDGPARPEVEALFARFGHRVRFEGRVDARDRLAALYGAAELLVWPAVNEAYGLALLEAQAMGCPVLAGRHGGVPDAVRDGITAVLVPPGDVGAFARALRELIAAPERRRSLGEAARRFVRNDRGLPQAAAILRRTLLPLLAGAAAPA